jgi:hypothetical protein
MSREHHIRAVAGSLVLGSLALGLTQSPYWFVLTGFVGANLLQSAFTGFCPLERILERAGIGEGPRSTRDVPSPPRQQ